MRPAPELPHGGLGVGRDTYCKWTGTPNGFGSQIQMDDGAQRIYRVVCPVLLLACVLLSLLASYGVGKPQHLLWCLSATFTAAAAFGGALVYGRPFHKVARRLAQSGGALAGWPGMAQSRKGDRVLITDGDLSSRSLETGPLRRWWGVPPR